MTLPDWLQNILTLLRDPEEGLRKKAVIDLFGLPPMDAYPKPIEVRTWTAQDWIALMKKLAFVEDTTATAHMQFVDAVLGDVKLKLPLTGTHVFNWQSSIQVAFIFRSDARIKYETYAAFLTILITHLAEFQAPPDALHDRGKFLEFAVACYRDEDILKRIRILVQKEIPFSCGTTAELESIIRTAKTEFDADRATVLRLANLGPEYAQHVKDALRVANGKDRNRAVVPHAVLWRLREVLDLLRAQDKELREEKQRKREAEEAEHLAREVERNKPSTKYYAEIQSLRQSMIDRFDIVQKANRSLAHHVEEAHAKVVALAFPAPPDGIDELPALRTAIAELEKNIKDDPWRHRLQALADLILASTSEGNLLKLATTSQELRERAGKELDAIKDADKKLARMKK